MTHPEFAAGRERTEAMSVRTPADIGNGRARLNGVDNLSVHLPPLQSVAETKPGLRRSLLITFFIFYFSFKRRQM